MKYSQYIELHKIYSNRNDKQNISEWGKNPFSKEKKEKHNHDEDTLVSSSYVHDRSNTNDYTKDIDIHVYWHDKLTKVGRIKIKINNHAKKLLKELKTKILNKFVDNIINSEIDIIKNITSKLPELERKKAYKLFKEYKKRDDITDDDRKKYADILGVGGMGGSGRGYGHYGYSSGYGDKGEFSNILGILKVIQTNQMSYLTDSIEKILSSNESSIQEMIKSYKISEKDKTYLQSYWTILKSQIYLKTLSNLQKTVSDEVTQYIQKLEKDLDFEDPNRSIDDRNRIKGLNDI